MQTGSDMTRPVANDKITGEKDTASIKCESCGANMIFDPDTQSLKCEHCGRVDVFEKDRDVREQQIEQAFALAEKWNGETSVFRCENCGARVVISSTEVAKICPFCNTTHIVKTEELAGIKPNAVYPFLVNTQKAVEYSRKWARSRIFSPRSFKKNLDVQNFHGVYQPCFTFDSRTNSTYSGRIGETRTRTVRTSKGTRTETYVQWYNVSGTLSKVFDDVTVASGKMTQRELDKIMPFRSETICVYEQEYLSGFTANHYERDLGVCWKDAKNMMDKTIRQAILNKYSCDCVDYLNVSTIHNGVTYKYVLLPVYIFSYRFRKKDYPVAVNGNTGKVAGKAPVSPLRVAIAVILGLALLAGVYFISKTSPDGEAAINSARAQQCQDGGLTLSDCMNGIRIRNDCVSGDIPAETAQRGDAVFIGD